MTISSKSETEKDTVSISTGEKTRRLGSCVVLSKSISWMTTKGEENDYDQIIILPFLGPFCSLT